MMKKNTNEWQNAKNPYGDGHACERILDAIAYYFKRTDVRPKDFV